MRCRVVSNVSNAGVQVEVAMHHPTMVEHQQSRKMCTDEHWLENGRTNLLEEEVQ